MVCNGSSPASSAHHWSNNRLIHGDTVFNGSWPWRLHDSRLSMQSCSTDHFAMLRCSTPAAYSIRRQIPTAVFHFQSLIVALVLSRLDYCNRVLFVHCMPTSSRDSNLFRTLLHGLSSESEDLSILLPRSSAVTDCASQSASPSNWLAWRTDQSAALHLVTYSRVSPVSPTWHQDDGCGLLPLIV